MGLAKIDPFENQRPTDLDLPVTQVIPDHLLPFVTQQDPSLYTPIDHASWRYILRVSQSFFKKYAHQKYLDGLIATGISTERIPLIEEMDRCLQKFGWRAVAVAGFVPPAVFLEFQSLGILVIACDMRVLEHLAYTPAPDIVHEAAGHAPIIADPEYRAYLRSYGEVARHAIFSDKDIAVYDAIRDLSDIKEDPASTPEKIQEAQSRFESAIASVDHVSEAAQLSRMAWWTIEYGLVGSMAHPKIYGAGLLSSVGESFNCLNQEIKKIPLSVSCIEQSYDITRPQPQLYVTPDFAHLNQVLEEFSQTMAFRTGGKKGLIKAQQASYPTTSVLDSGLQISGILEDFLEDDQGNPIFLKFKGPTQLSYNDHELEGHGAKTHATGFSAPIGSVRLSSGHYKPLSEVTLTDLEQLGFKPEQRGSLRFSSGIELIGKLKSILEKSRKTLLISFDDCDIRMGNQVLYQAKWGTFDLACGSRITSVFGGAADRSHYLKATGGYKQRQVKQKTNLTSENKTLNALYAQVRTLREQSDKVAIEQKLSLLVTQLDLEFPDDWLLRLELLELCKLHGLNGSWDSKLKSRLMTLKQSSAQQAELIERGLGLLA